MQPDTHFAQGPEGQVAYQSWGSGSIDVLFLPPWLWSIDLMWDEPRVARFLRRLGAFGRVIMFDKRGLGSSDPVPLGAIPTLEEWTEDMRVVLDAVGTEEAAIVANADSCPMAFVFAAAHPERTSAMVLIDGAARYRRDVDYPAGVPDRFVEPTIQAVTGTRDGFLVNYAPSLASDDRFVEWFHRFNRLAAGPSLQPKMFRTGFDWDLRAILPTIRVPTLVIHRAENRYLWAPHGRFLAENIEGARYVELPGADAAFFAGDQDAILDELEPFLTGERKEHERDRILATVLFTDIVSSTERVAELGDRRWRALLETHDGIVRQLIAEFRGREVKTMGDGFLATFDGPARGIRCAQAIGGQLRPLGLENRAGLHTGEVELRGDDVHGIGVHIAARVMAEAGPGEVVVSSTVKDLVVGSGIAFEDRGTHRLKGVPDEWRLYKVTS